MLPPLASFTFSFRISVRILLFTCQLRFPCLSASRSPYLVWRCPLRVFRRRIFVMFLLRSPFRSSFLPPRLFFLPLSGFGSTANFQYINQVFLRSGDLSVFIELRNWSVFFFSFFSMIISFLGRRVCLLAPLPVLPLAPDPSGIFPLIPGSQ